MKRNNIKCNNKNFYKIPGITGYLIDKNGNIFSEFIGRCLKPSFRSGYKFVQMQEDDGKIKNFQIHRLVAITFLPNHKKLPEVDHIDGNPLNNHVDNLRWVTKKENQNNPISKERRYSAIRKKQGIPIRVFYNNNFVGDFNCLMEAARKFNLHCTMISKQLRGKIDSVNGYTFEKI